MKKFLLALTTLTLVLVACGPAATPIETQPLDPTATSAPAEVEEETTEPTEEQAPPTATPEPEPAEPPDPVDVDVPGAAGLTLKGTFYGAVPNAAPGVLMLHMNGPHGRYPLSSVWVGADLLIPGP